MIWPSCCSFSSPAHSSTPLSSGSIKERFGDLRRRSGGGVEGEGEGGGSVCVCVCGGAVEPSGFWGGEDPHPANAQQCPPPPPQSLPRYLCTPCLLGGGPLWAGRIRAARLKGFVSGPCWMGEGKARQPGPRVQLQPCCRSSAWGRASPLHPPPTSHPLPSPSPQPPSRWDNQFCVGEFVLF